MNTKLNELTNIELYDELVPIVKQLCENFFYRDIKEYYLPIEGSDLFFKLYDIVLDYEYSKTPNLYKSIDDEGEIFFTGRGFQNTRAKKGFDIYKQLKWGEVYNNAKEVLDSEHLKELMQRYIEAPCHAMPYFLNNEILFEWIKNKKDSREDVNYELMLYNDPFVIDNINNYPEFALYLGLKFGNIHEDFEWLEKIFKYQVEDFVYVMLKMYHNYLNGINGFSQSEEIARHILEEVFKREWICNGRESTRPYALFSLAYYELGKCFEKGILYEQDYAKARYCYKKAGLGLGKNVIPALGDMYYYGIGVDINYDIAFGCYNDFSDYNYYANDKTFACLSEEEYKKRLSIFDATKREYYRNIQLEDFNFEEVRPEILPNNSGKIYSFEEDDEEDDDEDEDFDEDEDDEYVLDDPEEDLVEYDSTFDTDNDEKWEDVEKDIIKK